MPTSVLIKRVKDEYKILYPDPGWLPCVETCKACGGKPFEPPLLESFGGFTTAQRAIEEALAWYGKDVRLWTPKK